jgi:Putative metal-binding motif
MKPRLKGLTAGLGIALVVGLVSGCGVDAESNTGIRLNVTFHESIAPDTAGELIDTLRFYVAVAHPDRDVYLLNDAAAGIVVDVTGRDLFVDPYQLLVGPSGPDSEEIRVVVVGERNGVGVLYGQLLDPASQPFRRGSIVQRTIELRPAAQAFDMSWTVTGCLASSEMRDPAYEPFTFGSLTDMDCDGWEAFEDCDDYNAAVNPGIEEGYDCDGVDNDCDGIIDPGGDDDFDGDDVSACAGDCNDYDPNVYPGAPEICDAQDNDCDGKCDNADNIDLDWDGYADCGDSGSYIDHDSGTCSFVATPDCNDEDDAVHPGAAEDCNGKDDNCNGQCDEGWDPDGDGYTECGSWNPELDPLEAQCVDMETRFEDCGPEDGTVHPGAYELCDGRDTNCDGEVSNDTSICYQEGGDDGDCFGGQMTCHEANGEVWGDCSAISSELLPADRCAIWPYCLQSPSPSLCMDLIIQHSDMSCSLRYAENFMTGLCHTPGARAIYYLPYGFSGKSDCRWHLLITDPTANYQEIGLVDPNNPGQPATTVLNSCEAALVVTPFPGMSGGPGPVTGVLSFSYDNGPADFFALELDLSIEPTLECQTGEDGLTCSIAPTAP